MRVALLLLVAAALFLSLSAAAATEGEDKPGRKVRKVRKVRRKKKIVFRDKDEEASSVKIAGNGINGVNGANDVNSVNSFNSVDQQDQVLANSTAFGEKHYVAVGATTTEKPDGKKRRGRREYLLYNISRRDFLTYERNKFSFKYDMEHVIRIPHNCHYFKAEFVTLVSLKVPSGC